MDSATIIKEIESAFEGILLEDGIGINEAEAIDDYADTAAVTLARAKDRELWKNWQDIPKEIISKHYSSLCFVDPKGLRFLLPAYMCFTLRWYKTEASASIDTAAFALDKESHYFEGFTTILSKHQKSVIARFLRFLVLQVGDQWVDASQASQVYENYWHEYDKAV